MQEEDASRYVVFLKTAGRINRCTISCRRSVAEGGA
jgi:hypothetical protein